LYIQSNKKVINKKVMFKKEKIKKDPQDTLDWLKRISNSCEQVGQIETSLKMVKMFNEKNTLNHNQQKEVDIMINTLTHQYHTLLGI
tara:strand:- start:287 stop:547 length:261 start_codon:yes stop_codon:yes gene_type:complete